MFLCEQYDTSSLRPIPSSEKIFHLSLFSNHLGDFDVNKKQVIFFQRRHNQNKSTEYPSLVVKDDREDSQKFQINHHTNDLRLKMISNDLNRLKTKHILLKNSFVKKQLNLIELNNSTVVLKNQFKSLKEQYLLQLNHCEQWEKKFNKSQKKLKETKDIYQKSRNDLVYLSQKNEQYKEWIQKHTQHKQKLNQYQEQHKIQIKKSKKTIEVLRKKNQYATLSQQKTHAQINKLLQKQKSLLEDINQLENSLTIMKKKILTIQEESYLKYLKLIKKLKFKSFSYNRNIINNLIKHSSHIESYYKQQISKKNSIVTMRDTTIDSLQKNLYESAQEKKFLLQSYIKSQKNHKMTSKVISFSQLSSDLKKGSEQKKANAIVMCSHINDPRVVILLQEFLHNTPIPWLKQLAKETLNIICLNTRIL